MIRGIQNLKNYNGQGRNILMTFIFASCLCDHHAAGGQPLCVQQPDHLDR